MPYNLSILLQDSLSMRSFPFKYRWITNLKYVKKEKHSNILESSGILNQCYSIKSWYIQMTMDGASGMGDDYSGPSYILSSYYMLVTLQ